MKPRLAIGITTYKAIQDAFFGRALFEAYSAVSEKLTPSKVKVDSESYSIRTSKDFADHWVTKTQTKLINSLSGEIIESFDSLIGAEWYTVGLLSGGGKVDFAHSRDPERSSEITLQHIFSPKLDWVGLFHRLVDIFSPSYAMLHVFTDRELEAVDKGQRFAFKGPFAGEEHFTSWIDSQGAWRRPDKFQLKERRRYRFLPELAWANVLGSEFDGKYDKRTLKEENGLLYTLADGSTYLQLTSRIDDLVKSPEHVEEARVRLKSAFASDVFRHK